MADGKFYWLKLKRDFFKRHDIRIIEAMQNGKDYILFYLKLICESVDHAGNLRFSESIPYNAEMLSVITNTNIDVVKSAIEIFTELNMMEIMDDGTLYMTEVEKMIGSAADNPAANRQRRFREKQKELQLLACDDTVTKCNAPVTKNNESKSIEIDKEKELEIEKEKVERIPYEEIIAEYNATCVSLQKVTVLSDKRRKAIKSLYTNKDIGKANISIAFQMAQESSFLKGENKNGWKATFDWIMNTNNIIKILEGNYADRNPAVDVTREWLQEGYNG